MATNTETITAKKGKPREISKKLIKKDIEQKLEDAFAEFKGVVVEKKFRRSIEKAGEMLAKRFAKHKVVAKKASGRTAANARPKVVKVK